MEKNMIIDFHTHIFPEKIAQKTIEMLSKVSNIKAYTDGTRDGLIKSMRENGIAMSVVQPVMTKPSQFDTLNGYAESITGKDGILSFGGIHPDTTDYQEKLERIKEMGLRGIKLHPDYQKTYVDDPKMIRVIQCAVELGLIVLIHAGVDVGYPDPVHCTPTGIANMLEQIDDTKAKIVLAHMGGFQMWDAVEENLIGKNVWLDISYALGVIPDEQFMRMVRDHGADRILFGSDSPWTDQKQTYEYRNAVKLLGLSEEALLKILKLS
jgi:predicted TIM-barrel fold metal-dependent hydrolase